MIASYYPETNINSVLDSIVTLESSGNPYALGAIIDGHHLSFYPKSLQMAEALFKGLRARTTNIGIGLWQVNYHYHVMGTNIDPLTLFDPAVNEAKGCEILAACMDKFEVLWEAIGCYHSKTPKLKQSYAVKVLEIARRVGGG